MGLTRAVLSALLFTPYILLHDTSYGVATIRRRLKIVGLFRKRAPQKRLYCQQKRPVILRSLLIVATP